ncbi:sulfatase-like hydrolase/transferase, partial [Shimwellia pseudoproteus]|nr:sulfatase-like hydrolase/transferase [Shimwellia pseudoproteus]
CVCGKKIGPDPRNFNQRVSLGRNDLLIRTFPNMGRKHYDAERAANSEGLMDVVQKTGVSMLWKENDGGCKGACKRIPTIEIDPKADAKQCDGETCYDGVMLENVDDEISKKSGDKLIAFHFIGSHGPTYYRRYPPEFRHYMPECARSDIENCTQEQLVNTYDNTVRYTDYVLAQMIEKLKQYSDRYNTVLVYVSDHGESLGESGLYLHGTPYKLAPDQQTHVPMQVWMSPGFRAEKHIDLTCLKNNAAHNSYSHDNLFSSVLGLWDISTTVYDPNSDIFHSCR